MVICGTSPSEIEKAKSEMEAHLDKVINRKIDECKEQLKAMTALNDSTWESRTEFNPN